MTAVQLTVLGSGSAGNAALLSAGDTRVLIDAGLSRRRLRQRMTEAGLPGGGLSAILLTHEHADHAGHAAKVSAEFGCPVYLSNGTWQKLSETEAIPRRECFSAGARFQIGGIAVNAFLVSHDAEEPVGFRFEAEGVRFAYVVDLGCLTKLVKQYLRGCDCILIEANHDLERLRRGPYPWDLQQRIKGSKGHLSNDDIGNFLENDFDGSATHLVLAHLSETNNLPELARMAVDEAFARRGNSAGNGSAPAVEVHVTSRTAHLPTLHF